MKLTNKLSFFIYLSLFDNCKKKISSSQKLKHALQKFKDFIQSDTLIFSWGCYHRISFSYRLNKLKSNITYSIGNVTTNWDDHFKKKSAPSLKKSVLYLFSKIRVQFFQEKSFLWKIITMIECHWIKKYWIFLHFIPKS